MKAIDAAVDDLGQPLALPAAPALAEFCRLRHIRRLALFGSVLRGDFRPDSDIDVLVDYEPGHTPSFAFVDHEADLGVLLRRKVDLHTPQSLGPSIRSEVLREALTIHE